MASRERAIVNNLNERARFYGQSDQLTIEDVRAVMAFYHYSSCKSGTKPATSVDHVIPLAQGGTNTRDNLQLLTVEENKAKGDNPTDYRAGNICPDDFTPEQTQLESNHNNSSWGGARRGAGRKTGDIDYKKRELAGKIFTAEEEAKSKATIIAISQDADHPQVVAAFRVLMEYKHGKAPQMTVNATEDQYKAHLARLNAAILDDEPTETTAPEGGELSGDWILSSALADADSSLT